MSKLLLCPFSGFCGEMEQMGLLAQKPIGQECLMHRKYNVYLCFVGTQYQ